MTSTPPDPHTGPDPVPGAGAAGMAGLDLAGTVVERVLRDGDKSLLATGHHAGRPVVVKALVPTDGFWRDKLAHEISVYRALATVAAPVRTPGLVHTDGERLLIIDQLPGRVLDSERYPTRALTDELTAAITAVTGFTAWAPPAGALAPVFDCPERLHRYRGFFDAGDAAILDRLVAELDAPTAVAHGDPLPANMLLTTADTADPRGPIGGRGSGDGVALLDFEFTGLFLPGFDLAMLHTLLAVTPGAQQRIRGAAAAAGIDERALLVNRAIVLARELRIHRALDATAGSGTAVLRRDRLALLEPQRRALYRAPCRSTADADRARPP